MLAAPERSWTLKSSLNTSGAAKSGS
jgi:hypothetical protein